MPNFKYIIVDIDDTLAVTPEHSSIEEFHRLNHLEFQSIRDTITYVDSLMEIGHYPIFLTSRCETLLTATDKWLRNNLKVSKTKYSLCMRPYNNFLDPGELKLLQLRQRHIEPNHVKIWIDDNESTIILAKEAGYNIIHPNDIKGNCV